MVGILFFILFAAFAGVVFAHPELLANFPWLLYVFSSAFGMSLVAFLLKLTSLRFYSVNLMMCIMISGRISMIISASDAWNTGAVILSITFIGVLMRWIPVGWAAPQAKPNICEQHPPSRTTHH